jgi:hypothetical protein
MRGETRKAGVLTVGETRSAGVLTVGLIEL